MMKIQRLYRRLAILGTLVVLGWALFAQLRAWRTRGNLLQAQQEIAAGQLDAARMRLASLATRPGKEGGAVDYWLGVCEALAGRTDEALGAFARVPEGFPFDPLGAYLEAKANLSLGRLSPAERRLEAALARGGPGLNQVFSLLGHIYEIQVRFDDSRGLLLVRLAGVDDPVNVLRELSNFDLRRLPYEGLRAALDKSGELAPDDPRVWLGKARLAIHAGRWDEAASWLGRCRDAGADTPVWRAWLEWARGSSRVDEALEAASRLGQGHLEMEERLELLAWVDERRGDLAAETTALGRWLELEPTATRAMERLAELAHRAGQSRRVGELRRRKSDVERALEAYRLRLWRDEPLRGAADRSALAHLAEAAGHRPEARALYSWAMKADPADQPSREGLARLDRADAQRRAAVLASVDPLTVREEATRPGKPTADSGPAAELAFTDDATAAGLRFIYDNAETPIHQLPEPFGGGLALLDYDGDGWLDVYCVQGGPFDAKRRSDHAADVSGDRLYRNRGDGTFEDVTEACGIARFPRGHGHGVATGDIDGDGRTDLFVTRWRSYALYRNKGDGTFEDITDGSGLGGRRDWPTSAAFADLDGDGDLDLYVCHYAAWDLDNPKICRDTTTGAYLNCSPLDAEALPDRLFRNDGSRFTDVTAEAGIVDRDGRGLGVVAADLDGDGKVDLFVANDSSANFLYRNLGGMHFEEVGHESGVAGNASGAYQAGMGVAAGDLDGDGLIDICVTNFYGESVTFFRNLGSGVFCDATEAVGLGVATRRLLGFGIALFDADDDGTLDLATANGHVNDIRPNYPYRMPFQILRGGAGRLTDVSDRAGAPWQVPHMGRGLAVGDVDNDGRPDLVVLSHNEPLAYLHNRSTVGRFLTLRLEGDGRASNRDAVGAKVVVNAGGRRRVAYRTGGGSYQSASDPRLHFGLGAAGTVDLVEIAWPSGRVDRHRDLRADTGYLIREGDERPGSLRGFSRDAGSGRPGG
jgi:tetratricopeptide (TPR) repeat protein